MTTLQITDSEGKIVEERNFLLSSGDTIVFEFQHTRSWLQFLHLEPDVRKKIVDDFLEAVNSEETKICFLPPDITIRIIRKDPIRKNYLRRKS